MGGRKVGLPSCILNSNQRVGCAARSPLPAQGCGGGTPVGPVAGEAVLRKAVCGHARRAARRGEYCGALPRAGSCRVPAGRSPFEPGWPGGAFALKGWQVGLRGDSESCTGHAGWCKDPREAVQGLLQPPVR